MKKSNLVAVSAALALALGTAAHAADLFTSSLLVEPGQVVTCTAVNNGRGAQDIVVELDEGSSGPVFGPQNCEFVKPGGICRQLVSFPLSAGAHHVVMCRVTVATKATVRGTIANDTTGNNSLAR